MKLNFSGLTLKQALQMVPTQNLSAWEINVPEKPPTDILHANLNRLQSFELFRSEAAKVMLIDTLLAEVVPNYPALKVWKAAPLEAEKVMGVADYLIAPKRAYVETPLLCAIEAKRDDFDMGEVQCIAGCPLLGAMTACRDNNKRDGHTMDVYGIVSNGQGWVFYKLTTENEVFVSPLFSSGDLPKLLGVLNAVCAACAKNVP